LAIELVEVGADYVESDAAASQLSLAGRGGETGMKEKFQQGALIKILRVVGRNQAGFNGGGADTVIINAAAIILHLYIYVVAAMVSAHRYVAHFALARMVAIFAALQAVGHGIAHQV